MVTLDTLASENIQHGLFVADKVLFAVSTGLCLLVLALVGWIYSVKEARPHLRRVSFRLMLWALLLTVPYGVFRLFLISDGAMASPIGCSIMSTLFFQTLFTVNCLITCIALNLYLITCLGVNPLQLRLERWYVAGSLFFGLGLPIIPAALGHLGRDPLYGICYLSVGDEDLRLRVLIAELVIWQILSCVVASLAVGAAIIRLFRQSRATKRAMRISMQFDDQPLDLDLEDPTGNGSSEGGSKEGKTGFLAIPSLSPIIGSPNPLLGADNVPNTLETPAPPRSGRWRVFKRFSNQPNNGQLHEKVMRVALRISLYPIALIVINIVQSVTDIYFAYTINNTGGNVGRVILYVFYRATYAGRGIVLALLCLFCDPCLKRGLDAAWQHTFAPQPKQIDSFLPLSRIPSSDDNSKNQAPMSLADFMNVSVLNKTYAVPETRRASVQSLDITSALRRLPFHPANLHPFDAIRTERRRSKSDEIPRLGVSMGETSEVRLSSASFTRSFAGVASASLPSSMTDDVDVDLRLTYSPSRVRYTPHQPIGEADTGDIADELEPLPGQERYGETSEAIILQPIHATPRPSLISVPDARGIDRRLVKALDNAAQMDEAAADPSRSRHEGANVTAQTVSKKADVKDEPRKISWGSIPTAPVPPRILQRQKRQAAAAAMAERRSRELEAEEKRRLQELEVQL